MIQFQKKKKKCFKMIPLFNPQHPLLFSYQIIQNILNICFFTFLSVLLVFEGQFEYQKYTLKIMAFIWALNVLIKLNTSIYIGTNIVVDREKIIANYIKKNALNDLLPFVSLILIQSSESINFYLAIISFVKVRNIKEENEDIQRQLCIAVKKYFSIQLINLVFKLFMIAHVIACMWQLILVIERKYLNVEVESTSTIIPDNRSWWIVYLESLYWSLTLMATGSNLANTPLSVSFTCLNMLITTVIFGYLINVIGVMLSAIDEQEQMQRRDINIINDYMRKRCISKNLQRRVNIDLEYFYQKNYKKISEENEQVLSKISTHLSEQIHREYYGRILKKIQYISKYFSEQTHNKIIDCIEELYYLPNQIIFREDQNSDFSLMYIAEGSVELSRQVSAESQISKTLAVLGQECIFGQHSFFTGHVRGACAKSKAFTTIIKISRDKFLNVIQQNEKDYEQFCQIKDDIMIYKNYEKIQVKCFTCNKFNHYSSDCPLTHFDREDFYGNMSHYQKVEQFRKYKERNKKKKTNTLLITQQVKDASNQMVQIEFKEYIEEVEKIKDYPVTELDTEEESESEFQSKIKSREEFASKQRNSVLVQSMNELQEFSESKKSQRLIQEAKSKLQISGKDEFGQIQERLENQRSSINNILESNNYQLQDMKASMPNKGSIKRIEFMDRDAQQSIDKRNQNNIQKLFQDSQFKLDFLVYFDKAKEFQIYYPNGNYRILINKYNRAMKKSLKKKKQNKKN
ncbi:cation channel family protein (macronuclear) [Tetrahymena thermophila SB210]|uniref:Cation channel family protein n=1 Tax=Tetrahymena thermophila (strain SB210) TaxID=312017 RepID=W7XI67_TETTS|nr:cation channel family protein [Tetrahymena thermophila SB210]EWS73049.1 cation channel family protein [Tetrahymena thermophila SB210]|eukprot:XP_012654446.1 cation channel family protein [Tetrahymena thermophila SB210]